MLRFSLKKFKFYFYIKCKLYDNSLYNYIKIKVIIYLDKIYIL